MQGLMVPNLHADPGPNTAADHGQHQQPDLRDTLPVRLCLPLVETIQKESNPIDTNEIGKNKGGLQAYVRHHFSMVM